MPSNTLLSINISFKSEFVWGGGQILLAVFKVPQESVSDDYLSSYTQAYQCTLVTSIYSLYLPLSLLPPRCVCRAIEFSGVPHPKLLLSLLSWLFIHLLSVTSLGLARLLSLRFTEKGT